MALSADLGRISREGSVTEMGIEAGETIYLGGLVSGSASGHAKAATLTAGDIVFGVSESPEQDNSAGSDGDLTCNVRRGAAYWLSNSSSNPISLAQRGKNAFLEDDEYVRDYVPAGVNVPVGIVLDVDTNKGVLVLVGIFSADMEAGVFDELAVSGNAAIGGTLTVPYHAMTTGGVPSQADMVAAFGAAADGLIGVVWDDTPGVSYLCHANAASGWYYGTSTVGA